MRLDTARDEFLADKRTATKRQRPASPETLRSYKGRVTSFIEWVGVTTGKGKATTLHMTAELARRYLAHRSSLNRSQHTLSLDSTALREFAAWGAEPERRYWRWEDVAKIPAIGKPETLPRPYSDPERDAIMNLELSLPERVLRGLLYFSGLRRQEAASVRIQDVIPPAHLGDGTALPGRLHIWGKGAKERTNPIHDDLWATIRDYLATLPTKTPLDRTLLAKADGSPWTGKMVQRHVRAWGKAAGVSTPKSHRMRHTFASNLYDATEDVGLVQKFMGHASPATTMIYAKLSDRRKAAAIKRLPSFLPLSATPGLDSPATAPEAPETPSSPNESEAPR